MAAKVEIGARLAGEIERRGWTKKRLADVCKIHPQEVNRYLRGESDPQRLFVFLEPEGFDIDWLLTGKESSGDTEKPRGRSITLYSITNPGGIPMLKEERTPATLPEQFFTNSNAIAVIVPDNTLAPLLHKNDIIYVEESKPPSDKDLYLVRVKGKGHLIRHILLSGDLCTLVAPGAPSMTVPVSKLVECRRVIAATIFGAHLKHK